MFADIIIKVFIL